MEGTEIQYRFLQLEDAAQLANLYRTIFKKSVDPGYFEVKYSLRNAEQLQLTTVALIGDKVIGCFGVLLQEFSKKGMEETYPLALSCDFFILPEFQGKGVFKKLYEYSRSSCEKLGIDMYAFHSIQTDKVCRKWGWKDEANMSRFHIKVFPFSTSRIGRVLGLKKWRINKVKRLFEDFKTDADLNEMNANSEMYTNTYSPEFFQSKSFCERQYVKIDNCVLLLKYDHLLTIGFVQFGEDANVPSMLKKVKNLARKALIHEVVFQVHSSSKEAKTLREFLEEKASFPISSIAVVEKGRSFSEVKLNLLDMDIF